LQFNYKARLPFCFHAAKNTTYLHNGLVKADVMFFFHFFQIFGEMESHFHSRRPTLTFILLIVSQLSNQKGSVATGNHIESKKVSLPLEMMENQK
jgi:hypothetical protein